MDRGGKKSVKVAFVSQPLDRVVPPFLNLTGMWSYEVDDEGWTRNGDEAMSVNHARPNCGSVGMAVFYELKNVPVHSVQTTESQIVISTYSEDHTRRKK